MQGDDCSALCVLPTITATTTTLNTVANITVPTTTTGDITEATPCTQHHCHHHCSYHHPTQAAELHTTSSGNRAVGPPGDSMKMIGAVLLLSFMTDLSDTGPGSAKWGPRVVMTYCWTAATKLSGRTSFNRHSFCIGLTAWAPCMTTNCW